ncbi:MAG: DUF2852 domain-containing protein [Rhodobacteraceae bacterium]|nr:DUF2852 domain-containing protein [Paracoccaceae bacterium]
MTTYSSPAEASWPHRAESWLDERGPGAWIAALVVSLVVFWPIGLVLLAYMLWTKRIFAGHCRGRMKHGTDNLRHTFSSSGNSAFDAYKAETLRRLEEEQDAFESFLDRLRAAKDKAEFDEFMDERAKRARDDEADEKSDK